MSSTGSGGHLSCLVALLLMMSMVMSTLPALDGSYTGVDVPYLGGPSEESRSSLSKGEVSSRTNAVPTPCILGNYSDGIFPIGMSSGVLEGQLILSDGYNRVWDFNTTTNTLDKYVQVNGAPTGVAADPTQHLIFSADLLDSNVSIINGWNFSLAGNLPIDFGPLDVIYDNISHQLFVDGSGGLSGYGKVSIINVSSLSVKQTITVGSYPAGMGIDTNHDRLYIANSDSDNVSVIDGLSDRLITSISVGQYPSAITYNPSDNEIYVVDDGGNSVSVINDTDNKVIGSFALSVPSGFNILSINPTNGDILALDTDGLSVIDPASRTTESTVAISRPFVEYLDRSNGMLYVGGAPSNLYVVSLDGNCPGTGQASSPSTTYYVVAVSIVVVVAFIGVYALKRSKRGRRSLS